MNKDMQTSVRGVALIKEFEGLRLKAYQDQVGVWTIGWGHTRTAKRGMEITLEEAERLLRMDIKNHERPIHRYIKAPLTQYQFDALSSFVFNLGISGLYNTKTKQPTTITRMINAGQVQEAASQFDRWVFSGGRRNRGLVRRRAKERAVYEGRAG